MKICVVVGTRPEIIKAGPVIKRCEELKLDYFILHTGQHYSANMDKIFFEDLKLPAPKYNLGVGSGPHGAQTGSMLEKIEKILVDEKPSVVLVTGDTNSVLAGALAASKLRVKIGHIEAGLRSHDRDMAEEQNRIVTDHLSDFLFTPTQKTAELLYREGIPREKVFVVGNTVVDATLQNIDIAEKTADILSKLGLREKQYITTTVHRPENVDNELRLKKIIEGLNKVHLHTKLPIIFSVHPRTKKRLEEIGANIGNGIKIIEPIGYIEFLQLLGKSHLVITDSGGIQEETSVLQVPCVTIRDNTERPETLEIGSNKLAGVEPDSILQTATEMGSSSRDWKTPYGDGMAGARIVDVLLENLKSK